MRTDRRGDDRGGPAGRQDADQPGIQTEGYDPQEPARGERTRGAAGRDDREDGDKKAPVVVEEEPRFDRVWTVDVAGGAVSRATDAAAHVRELAWLPDGRALAVVVADEPPASAWYSCRLARLDLERGDLTTLRRPPPGRQVARPAPSPVGARVAVASCSRSDPGMSGGDLYVVPAAGGEGRAAGERHGE